MTLLELVMVICVLVILAAIVVPRMNFKKDAQRANCYASVDAIRAGLSSYNSKAAIAGTASYPVTLSDASFLPYLNGDKLPKHPTKRVWDDYYSTQDNGAQYLLATGRNDTTGACTGF